MNPHRVLVQHLRDEKYSVTDDVIKVCCGQLISAGSSHMHTGQTCQACRPRPIEQPIPHTP